MKKILSALIVFMLASPFVFASMGLKTNGTPSGAVADVNIINTSSTTTTFSDGFTLSLPILDPNLFAAGTGNGGATSIASTVTAVPVSFSYVRKVITANGDPAFTAGTMANGKPGQIITIAVSGISPGGAQTGGNFTITPTTSTGFSSIKLSAVNDVVSFLYVSDTAGWTITTYDPAASNSITITLKP